MQCAYSSLLSFTGSETDSVPKKYNQKKKNLHSLFCHYYITKIFIYGTLIFESVFTPAETMAIQHSLSLLILFLLTFLASGEPETRSTYIIHLSSSVSRARARTRTQIQYPPPLHSLLPSHLLHPSPSHIYTYTLAAYGYAAILTPAQAHYLESQPSVLSIQPDQVHQPHTTHTPSFLSLSPSSGLWPTSNLAIETIVAVLDTGIWPQRPCFACNDSFPAPPSKWKGKCVSTPSFNGSELCNNKLIGAKFYSKGYEAALGRSIDETKESRL